MNQHWRVRGGKSRAPQLRNWLEIRWVKFLKYLLRSFQFQFRGKLIEIIFFPR
jgi:hypothetical protein